MGGWMMAARSLGPNLGRCVGVCRLLLPQVPMLVRPSCCPDVRCGRFHLCCLWASTDCVVSFLGFSARSSSGTSLMGVVWATCAPVLLRWGPAVPLAQIAMKYSECSSSKAGGNLGWFPRGKMEGKFQEKAFGNAPGTCSEPYVARMTHTLRGEPTLCLRGGCRAEGSELGGRRGGLPGALIGVSVPARAGPPLLFQC